MLKKGIFTRAAFAFLLVFISSCVSMADRYAGAQRTVSITAGSLKSRESGKYAGPNETAETPSSKTITLKILLSKTRDSLYITAESKATVPGLNIEPSAGFSVSRAADGTIIVNGVPTSLNRIEIICPGNVMKYNRKAYRGSFVIFSGSGALMLVNKIELEQYLYGVLPFEVSTGWEPEVLKAQAVAARTFAIYNKLKNKTPEYDLDSNVNSQVYGGMSKENPATNDAIDRTAGEVLSYNGEVIQAFFHANSGGRTASSLEVWGGAFDYLPSVDDPFSTKSKGARWSASISRDKLSSMVEKAGYKTGSIYEILIQDRTESGRVKTLKIKGSEGEYVMKAKDLRAAVGVDQIRSTNFTVSGESDSFDFEGLGWGHGVGMSQEGAREMADEGWSYKEILSYYYKGTKLKKIKIE